MKDFEETVHKGELYHKDLLLPRPIYSRPHSNSPLSERERAPSTLNQMDEQVCAWSALDPAPSWSRKHTFYIPTKDPNREIPNVGAHF